MYHIETARSVLLAQFTFHVHLVVAYEHQEDGTKEHSAPYGSAVEYLDMKCKDSKSAVKRLKALGKRRR